MQWHVTAPDPMMTTVREAGSASLLDTPITAHLTALGFGDERP